MYRSETINPVTTRCRASRINEVRVGVSLAFVVPNSARTWKNGFGWRFGWDRPEADQELQLPQPADPGTELLPVRRRRVSVVATGTSAVQVTLRNADRERSEIA